MCIIFVKKTWKSGIKIDELTKLVRKLIGLTLEIGTLVSIIMMILHSIK